MKGNFVRTVSDSVLQHVDGAALRDLALKPGEEPASDGAIFARRQRSSHLRLGGMEKGGQLEQIDTVLAVMVDPASAAPADAAVLGARLPGGIAGGRFAGMTRQSGAESDVRGRIRRCR